MRHIHSDDELRAKLATGGVPDVVVTIMLGFYTAACNGEFATIDPTLERLLGRPTVRMRDMIFAKIGR